MKKFEVIEVSANWSIKSLSKKVEQKLNEKSEAGWEIISVSFNYNIWGAFTAFITVQKSEGRFG